MPASDEFSSGSVPAGPIGPRTGETIVEWPHCPACGEARSTRCPACDTVGAVWEQAFGVSVTDHDAADNSEQYRSQYRGAVICPTCDEVFRPTLARRCTSCRHDFAENDTADTASAGHLSDETAGRASRHSAGHAARMILTVIAAAGVIYTLYDWLVHNTGGARLF
ncbi:MAG: hypothetical protein WD875_11905 [Pirellulales bacterium]